jgi:hypothetical protein
MILLLGIFYTQRDGTDKIKKRYSNVSTLKFDLVYFLVFQFNNYGFIMCVFISVYVVVVVYAFIVAIHVVVILTGEWQ